MWTHVDACGAHLEAPGGYAWQPLTQHVEDRLLVCARRLSEKGRSWLQAGQRSETAVIGEVGSGVQPSKAERSSAQTQAAATAGSSPSSACCCHFGLTRALPTIGPIAPHWRTPGRGLIGAGDAENQTATGVGPRALSWLTNPPRAL